MSGKCGPQQIEFPDGTCSGNVCGAMQVLKDGRCVPCDSPQGKRYENGICYDMCKADENFIARTSAQIYDEMCAALKSKGVPCNPPYMPNIADIKPVYTCVKKCGDGQTYIVGRCVDKNKLFLWAVVFFNVLLVLVFKQNLIEVLKLDISLFVIYVVYVTISNPEKAGEGLVTGIWGAVKGIGKGIWGGITSIF